MNEELSEAEKKEIYELEEKVIKMHKEGLHSVTIAARTGFRAVDVREIIKENEEGKIKEINFVVGAVDGKTLERVKRLITYLHQYQWAYGELQLLIDLQNIDGTSQVSDTERRREEIRKKLHSGLHEADLSLGVKYE